MQRADALQGHHDEQDRADYPQAPASPLIWNTRDSRRLRRTTAAEQ